MALTGCRRSLCSTQIWLIKTQCDLPGLTGEFFFLDEATGKGGGWALPILPLCAPNWINLLPLKSKQQHRNLESNEVKSNLMPTLWAYMVLLANILILCVFEMHMMSYCHFRLCPSLACTDLHTYPPWPICLLICLLLPPVDLSGRLSFWRSSFQGSFYGVFRLISQGRDFLPGLLGEPPSTFWLVAFLIRWS